MKQSEARESSTEYLPETIRQKLGEADLYLTQGLFDEARGIYLSLLRHFGELGAQRGAIPDSKREVARGLVRVLKKKVEEVDRRAVEFHGRPKPEHLPPPEEPARDGESTFNAGLALEEIGLYREAIEEFKRAAELRYRIGECYEHLGNCHILEGNYPKGIETLRFALRLEGITPAEKVGILQKIASACEKAGDKKVALETYRDLLALDKASAIAEAKIQELALSQRRFRFNLGPEMVCRHPRMFLVASLLFASLFLAFLPFVKTVDNVDYFTLENDPDVNFYRSFKKVFGNDEFFVIAFSKENMFTAENLALLRDITRDLEGVDGMRRIRSLANVDHTIGGEDYFEVGKFLERIPEGKAELEALRRRAVGNPLYARNLISVDGRTAGILAGTYDRPEDESYRRRILEKTSAVLDRYRDRVEKFYVGGWTATNVSLSQYMKQDVATFIPITYLLITATIWLFFRNLRLVFLAVGNISIALGCTMGLFGMLGIRLHNVTSIIPPLVMAYALSDTVHIFTNLERRTLAQFPDRYTALAGILSRLWVPCFLTSFTTFVGFLSCAASQVTPIREFAYVASAGMIFEWVFSFYLMPPLILFFKPETIYQDFEGQRRTTRVLRLINDLNQKHYVVNVVVCGALMVAGCWFASKIRVETNLLEYFKAGGPVRTSLAFVEEKLSGVGTLDVSAQAGNEDAFKEPANLHVLERIQDHVKSLEGVDVAVSFVDFIKEMNQSFHNNAPSFYKIPGSREMVAQYLLLYDSKETEDFVNNTYDHARIGVRISEHNSATQAKLISEIKRFIETIDHPGLDLRVTGRAVQDVNVIDALVKGQIYSLGSAFVVIGITMCLALRSFVFGLYSLIPNIFPLVLNFGLMGILGIPLNTATALISAMALGMAVDNTIHFLSEYRIIRREGVSVSDAVREIIFDKGRPMISSALMLFVGFGVLVTSRFVPAIQFGVLTAVIMITALIGDIIMDPSMLLLKGERSPRRERSAWWRLRRPKAAEGKVHDFVGNH